MRRMAAVLVLLLTASAAWAGYTTQDLLHSPVAWCSALVFVFLLVLGLVFLIVMAVNEQRNARRPPPPPEDG